MKSEKGITLASLVIYISILTIIVTIITTISSYFYKNVVKVHVSPSYVSEFNKFSMFFVTDVKRNTKINTMSSTRLEFGDGTIYKYENNAIYRNDLKIAKNVKSFKFTETSYTVNTVTKKIVNVNTVLGNNKEEIERNIDYVLKYW